MGSPAAAPVSRDRGFAPAGRTSSAATPCPRSGRGRRDRARDELSGATSRRHAAVSASGFTQARWTPRPTRRARAEPDDACHPKRCPRRVNLGATALADVHGRYVHIDIHMAIHRTVLVFPQGYPQLGVDDGGTSLTTTFVTEMPLTCGSSRSKVQLTSAPGCATGADVSQVTFWTGDL